MYRLRRTRRPSRRTSVHGLAARRGVVRHGRALVPRAAAAAFRGPRAGGAGVATRSLAPRFVRSRTGLEASRQRRQAAQARGRRRLATRTVPAVALVLGSATMLPIAASVTRRRAGRRPAAGGSSEPDLPARPRGHRASRSRRFCVTAPPPTSRWGASSRGRRSSGRSSGTTRHRSASPTRDASSTERSFPSKGRTGSRGIRSRTAFRTCRTGSTATSTRSGRSSP